MSAATCWIACGKAGPGYRFAHPGYEASGLRLLLRQLRDARCITMYDIKEIALADNFKKQHADAQFKKTQLAQDGRKAVSEYESDAAAVRAKTAQLRQLRLARDAKDAAAQPAAAATTKAKRTRKPKSASGTLANWLKDRDESGHST
jgi:hypothetical protein